MPAKPTPSRSSTPLLLRADIALWKLPRPLRKAMIAPVALAAGVSEAWPQFRYGWRTIMRAVDTRPSEQPDPSEGRGQMPFTEPMDDPPAPCPCGDPIGGPPCNPTWPCHYAEGMPPERWLRP